MKISILHSVALTVFFALFTTGYVVAQDEVSIHSFDSKQQKRPAINDKPFEIEYVNGYRVAAGEVIVKFREKNTNKLTSLLANFDLREHRILDDLHIIKSGKISALELVNRFAALPEVESVYPNYIFRIDALPNDEQFDKTWGLRNTGQTVQNQIGNVGADIKAVPAWNITTGSRGIVVAVFDTGINYTHPDLAENIWSAPNTYSLQLESNVSPIECFDGTHGYDFINDDCEPSDDQGHGTHIAGILGASGNNNQGVSGVNWQTSILPLKICNVDGDCKTDAAIRAIKYAIKLKELFGLQANIRVLNNSWGGAPFVQGLLDQVNQANANNMLFVASSGNGDGELAIDNDIVPHYPASFSAPNVVSVAAINNFGNLTSFSNYGRTTVHLAAPGRSILSTVMSNSYGYDTGTSQATPFVSGAAALILSRCSLNTAALKEVILNNVDRRASLIDKTSTGGSLNIYKALNKCASEPVANNYKVSILESDGLSLLRANDINNNGQIVGSAEAPFQSFGIIEQPSIYDVNSGITIISPSSVPFGFIFGTGINNQGWITGETIAPDPLGEGFFYNPASGMQNLGISPGYSSAQGFAVNDSGVVVGRIRGPGDRRVAFYVRRPGSNSVGVTFLDPAHRLSSGAVDINNKGQIATYSEDPNTGVHQFYIADIAGAATTYTTIEPPTGFRRLNPSAINENGMVVGEASPIDMNTSSKGFIYDPVSGVKIISSPNDFNVLFNDVNDAGQAVGTSGGKAVIYDSVNGLKDLNTLIPGNSGLVIVDARSINNKGQIVARAGTGNGYQQVLLSPSHHTSSGSNVQVQTGSLAIVFSQVTAPGETFVGPLPLPPDSKLPTNYLLTGSSLAYDVRTTATFTGTNRVCFNLISISDEETFNRMKLLHFENGEYVDRTVSRDYSTLEICADVASFSPFVVAQLNSAAPTSIAGSVTYGTSSQSVKYVPGVTLTAAGTPEVTATSDVNGSYLLSALGVSEYTVKPSKAKQTTNTGISIQDASEAAKIAFNQVVPTANQRVAADATGNGAISMQDASEIAKRAFNIQSTNTVGSWKFSPEQRTYSSVTNNLTAENFEAILVGDVTGNWTAASNFAEPVEEETVSILTANSNQPDAYQSQEAMLNGVTVSLSTASGSSNATVTIPVTVGDLTGQGITSYEMTVSFDPSVLQPASPAFSTTGTRTEAAGGYTVLVDPTQPTGRLRIGAFGTTPLSGQGTLINLRFTVLPGGGATSALNFEQFIFGEGGATDPTAKTTNGSFVRLGPTAASTTVSGRVFSENGRSIVRAQVSITDAEGNIRTALTNSFGYFRFESVSVGQTYVFTISAKGRQFAPQVVAVNETMDNLNFSDVP